MFFRIVAWVLFAGIVFLWMTAPNLKKRARALPAIYAHRGLHGTVQEAFLTSEGSDACWQGIATENGLKAFERAVCQNIGIELDVRLSKDAQVVVYHDRSLERLQGRPVRVDELTLDELRQYPLPDGGRISTLEEVLALVKGRVPLLIEIKSCFHLFRLCKSIWKALRTYAGEYAVESFNPLAMLWFRLHAKGVLRGQLVSPRKELRSAAGLPAALLLTSLAMNFLSRPDFIAYEVDRARTFPIWLQRRLFKGKLVAWTVKSRAAIDALVANGESAIFETHIGSDPIIPLEGKRYV